MHVGGRIARHPSGIQAIGPNRFEYEPQIMLDAADDILLRQAWGRINRDINSAGSGSGIGTVEVLPDAGDPDVGQPAVEVVSRPTFGPVNHPNPPVVVVPDSSPSPDYATLNERLAPDYVPGVGRPHVRWHGDEL